MSLRNRSAQVNVCNSGCGDVFMGPGYWQQQRWRWRKKTEPRTQQQRHRRCRRMRKWLCVWEIRDNDRGGGGSKMVPRGLWQRHRRRGRKMSTKISTTTTTTLSEGRRYIQGIRDGNGGGNSSAAVPMDWQWRWSVDFTCYHIATSNTISSLSLLFFCFDIFHRIPFLPIHCKKDYRYCNNVENIFGPSVH